MLSMPYTVKMTRWSLKLIKNLYGSKASKENYLNIPG